MDDTKHSARQAIESGDYSALRAYLNSRLQVKAKNKRNSSELSKLANLAIDCFDSVSFFLLIEHGLDVCWPADGSIWDLMEFPIYRLNAKWGRPIRTHLTLDVSGSVITHPFTHSNAHVYRDALAARTTRYIASDALSSEILSDLLPAFNVDRRDLECDELATSEGICAIRQYSRVWECLTSKSGGCFSRQHTTATNASPSHLMSSGQSKLLKLALPPNSRDPGSEGTLDSSVLSSSTSTDSAESITHITMGRYHGIMVTDLGNVYVWGENGQSGRLGLPIKEGKLPQLIATDPIRLEFFGSSQQAVKAAVGDDHSLVLVRQPNKNAALFSWGKYAHSSEKGKRKRTSNITQIMLRDQTNIIEIAAGFNHCIALSDNGTVYAWGSNNRGQCAIEEVSEWIEEPTPILSGAFKQANDPVSKLLSKGDLCVAITKNGAAFIWGNADPKMNKLNYFSCPTRVKKTITKALNAEDNERWVQSGVGDKLMNITQCAIGGPNESLLVVARSSTEIYIGSTSLRPCELSQIASVRGSEEKDLVSLALTESHLIFCTCSGFVFSFGPLNSKSAKLEMMSFWTDVEELHPATSTAALIVQRAGYQIDVDATMRMISQELRLFIPNPIRDVSETKCHRFISLTFLCALEMLKEDWNSKFDSLLNLGEMLSSSSGLSFVSAMSCIVDLSKFILRLDACGRVLGSSFATNSELWFIRSAVIGTLSLAFSRLSVQRKLELIDSSPSEATLTFHDWYSSVCDEVSPTYVRDHPGRDFFNLSLLFALCENGELLANMTSEAVSKGEHLEWVTKLQTGKDLCCNSDLMDHGEAASSHKKRDVNSIPSKFSAYDTSSSTFTSPEFNSGQLDLSLYTATASKTTASFPSIESARRTSPSLPSRELKKLSETTTSLVKRANEASINPNTDRGERNPKWVLPVRNLGSGPSNKNNCIDPDLYSSLSSIAARGGKMGSAPLSTSSRQLLGDNHTEIADSSADASTRRVRGCASKCGALDTSATCMRQGHLPSKANSWVSTSRRRLPRAHSVCLRDLAAEQAEIQAAISLVAELERREKVQGTTSEEDSRKKPARRHNTCSHIINK